MDQVFSDSIVFLDENGMQQECSVEYEWKPRQCLNCLKYGHDANDCRISHKKKVWLKKSIAKSPMKLPAQKEIVVEMDGFHKVLQPIILKLVATTYSYHKCF